LVSKTTMDYHNKLVLHSLRNNQPRSLLRQYGTYITQEPRELAVTYSIADPSRVLIE